MVTKIETVRGEEDSVFRKLCFKEQTVGAALVTALFSTSWAVCNVELWQCMCKCLVFFRA